MSDMNRRDPFGRRTGGMDRRSAEIFAEVEDLWDTHVCEVLAAKGEDLALGG